ncbi:MAG: hypothetical protein ACJAZ9_001681 [Neolewinella sp.]|jgi:hypothetical protein
MPSTTFQSLTEKGFSLRPWLVAGVVLELLIFGACYFMFDDIGEVFRHSARYSGRLSLFIYLFAFSYFALTFYDDRPEVMANVKKLVTIFCVLHFIHFSFLATNVIMNDIELIPYKLAGGFLGYLMILLYPFFIDRISNKKLHLIYFYYLGLVMVLTYVARIKGEFEGVTSWPIHYFGAGVTLLAILVYSYIIFARPPVQRKD